MTVLSKGYCDHDPFVDFAMIPCMIAGSYVSKEGNINIEVHRDGPRLQGSMTKSFSEKLPKPTRLMVRAEMDILFMV